MATSEKSRVVACTLSARDLAAQAARWLALRASAERNRMETDVGLRVTFEDREEVEAELRALVAVENDCCSWAGWRVLREDGELVLHVSSTAHGVRTLHEMFRSAAAED
jgi:hypothetical protein